MAEDDRPLVAVIDVMPPLSRDVIGERFGSDFRLAFADESTASDRRQLVREATVLLPMRSGVDAPMMDAAPRCRVIQKLGVGTDNIDGDAARRRNITVLKEAGINADAVAELAVLLTLAVTRNLLRAAASARSGRFEKEVLRAESVQLVGRTVGVVGMGHIGRAAARRFAAFGMRIVYFDPYRLAPEQEASLGIEFRELDELLAESDVITLHMPSPPGDRPLFDDATFAKTRPGAVLVNTARGSLVDEDALARAIADGRLRGAGLDVTNEEPLPAHSPLLSLDRVVVTPHIGGAVGDNFPLVVDRAYRNVRAVLDGGDVADSDKVVWLR